MAHNNTGRNISSTANGDLKAECEPEVPSAIQLFNHQPWSVATVAVVCGLLTLFNVCLYLEQMSHVNKRFKDPIRRKNTLVILGVFPVFSITSLLALYVPRSGTLMKLVSNAFLGNVLYRYVSLLCSYFGSEAMYTALDGREVALRAGPVCCCCFCLPRITFDRKVYRRMKWLGMQVAIVRPTLMLLAAVLWADGAYTPGNMSPYGTFLYINIANVTSTLLAMYGLLSLTRVCQEPLAVFRVRSKLLVIQLILITTALLGTVLGILVASNAIPCTPPLSARDRAQRLDNAVVLTEMIPFAMLARKFYCGEDDANKTYSPAQTEEEIPMVTSSGKDPNLTKLSLAACKPGMTQSLPLLPQGTSPEELQIIISEDPTRNVWLVKNDPNTPSHSKENGDHPVKVTQA